MNARESFPRLLLSEWTKLRSVSRWVITFLGALALTIGLSALLASANRTDANVHRNFVVGPSDDPVSDTFYFVHQPVAGDTTLTVRVASVTPPQESPDRRPSRDESLTLLDDPGPYAGAAAGIMIKDGTRSGSSYAAVMLTADRGVRMQSDYAVDHEGSASSGTRWLRLVRAGNTVTGYESPDGTNWTPIGSLTPRSLPSTAEIGFYVSSAPALYTSRGSASSSVAERPTTADATFDNVTLDGAGQWKGDQIADENAAAREGKGGPAGGRLATSGSGFTVTGSGRVGPHAPDDDVVEAALIGAIAGLMALVSVGALFATSEYRRGMIRTTFAATPRRGRVLAAKAIVLGTTAYAVSLVGVVAALTLAVPTMKNHGFAPPAFPTPSLSDGPVVRALLLTAAFMALVSLFAMAVGMVVRRSAAAITATIVLVLLPLIVGMVLPGTAPRWLMYATLAGGMATQRAKPPTITLAEPWAMIGPWAGIGVVAAYTCAALALAWWRLRRTDA
ncbi:ABC transporter permease subunit [Asanoa sp. NPDC049573]|uniref:ABC transporter permease subunit n=1 Tax=Asanoa sp. NPDC049573 TaxID=3155396 RepID=UPI0034377C6A